MIVEFLSNVDNATTQEIADYIGLGASRTKDYLSELVEDKVITSEGRTKNRIYKLITKSYGN